MAKNCLLCGAELKQYIGKTRIVHVKGSILGKKVKNPDSIPMWCGGCRMEGRRQARKAYKKLFRSDE